MVCMREARRALASHDDDDGDSPFRPCGVSKLIVRLPALFRSLATPQPLQLARQSPAIHAWRGVGVERLPAAQHQERTRSL